jgi:hypothetical protein
MPEFEKVPIFQVTLEPLGAVATNCCVAPASTQTAAGEIEIAEVSSSPSAAGPSLPQLTIEGRRQQTTRILRTRRFCFNTLDRAIGIVQHGTKQKLQVVTFSNSSSAPVQ